MPCTDGGIPYPPTREEKLNAMAPAMLCALVSTLDKEALEGVLKKVNWAEAGITHAEFDEWWALHKRRDASRRAREKEYAERDKQRKDAIAKLTPAERRVLGIK